MGSGERPMKTACVCGLEPVIEWKKGAAGAHSSLPTAGLPPTPASVRQPRVLLSEGARA